MKPKVVWKKNETIMLDRLPHDIQAGDVVQIASPTGKARGKRDRTWQVKALKLSLLIVAVAVFLLFAYINQGVRHLWLVSVCGVLLYFAGITYGALNDD